MERAAAFIDRLLLSALESGHPAPFLLTISQLCAVIFRGSTGQRGAPAIRPLVESWADDDRVHFKAAAYGMAVLVGTEDDRATVRRIIGTVVGALPGWVLRLSEAEPSGVWLGLDELHANATVAVGLQLPTGEELTMLAVLDQDHVCDLVGLEVLPSSPEAATERWKADNVGGEVVELSPADARARVSGGITWACVGPSDGADEPRQVRAFVEWVLAKLPDGGQSLPEEVMSDVELFRALIDFQRSLPEELRDDPDVESIALSCLQQHSLFTDSLRWSAAAVDDFLFGTVLRQWWPLGRAYLIKYPDVLGALISYGHGVRGVRQARTDETLRSLEQLRQGFIAKLDELCGTFDQHHPLAGRRLLRLLDAESPADVDWSRMDQADYATAG